MKGAKEMKRDYPLDSWTRLSQQHFITHWLRPISTEIKVQMETLLLNANHFSKPVELL